MIDYLRVRFPTIDALAIIRDVLQFKADYTLLEDYGQYGYESQYVLGDITSFRDMVYEQRFEKIEKDMKRDKKALEQSRKRIAELDQILKRIYEDDVNETISLERVLKLS